ncbi:MAG: MbnP family copper-binding protein [Cyanobacteria bacterium P01_E01_bin.43]
MTNTMPQRLTRNSLLTAGLMLSGLGGVAMYQAPAIAVDSETVTLQFEGMVGDEAFACGQAYEIGAPATTMTTLDFRFYVSEVALIDADGNEVPLILEQDGLWQHQNVALIDFEDKSGACANGTVETRAQVVGSVPAGDYTGVKFTLGVPFALNHIDSTLAPSPLNLTALWWNWNFGYKFARIDFTPATDTAQASSSESTAADKQHGQEFNGFAMHLGSVGCQMDATQAPVVCSIPNRPEVMLTDFDPAQDVIVADLAALMSQTNLAENQEDTALGCMSSPMDSDCAGIMQNLGLPFNDQPMQEQTFFQVK